MPSEEIADFTELTTPADDDEYVVVDKDDTTDSPEGTTKRIQGSNVVAKKIKTTTGPAVLSVGAVGDGEVLKRSGATIIGAAIGGGGVGDVVGPGSAADNALARFDGTTGKLIQNSTVTLDDTGALTVPEMAAPSTPAAGKVSVYAKSDGKLYIKDDAGTETDLTATGSGTIGGSTGSTDNALLRADGTGGSTAQASAITVDDNGAITVPEIAAPSTPASGKVVLYAKSDGLLYSKDDAGTETVVTGGGGGGGVPASSTNIIPYSDGSAFQNSPVSREDANTLGHWNGTGETATRHNWYTNRVDASNYERLSIYYHTGNDHWLIDSNKGGTGTLRRLNVAMDGTIYWIFRTDGQFRAGSDTASTIAAGAGTASAPGYQLGTGGSSRGWFADGSSNWAYSDSNSHAITLSNGIFLKSNGGFYISSSTTPNGSNDISLTRDGTNRFAIKDGSANGGGNYADLKLRSLAGESASPSQITADQNNYNPGRQRFQRWSSDASRTVTGLGNSQVDGQEHVIVNVGSNSIVLSHQNASSSTGNRFLNSTGADITLAANEAADIVYDNTTSRWRVFKR